MTFDSDPVVRDVDPLRHHPSISIRSRLLCCSFSFLFFSSTLFDSSIVPSFSSASYFFLVSSSSSIAETPKLLRSLLLSFHLCDTTKAPYPPTSRQNEHPTFKQQHQGTSRAHILFNKKKKKKRSKNFDRLYAECRAIGNVRLGQNKTAPSVSLIPFFFITSIAFLSHHAKINKKNQ